MNSISNRLLDEFAEGCRQVAAHGLVRCRSGNLSWRIGADRMLIKSSRSWLGEMTRDAIAACRAYGIMQAEQQPQDFACH